MPKETEDLEDEEPIEEEEPTDADLDTLDDDEDLLDDEDDGGEEAPADEYDADERRVLEAVRRLNLHPAAFAERLEAEADAEDEPVRSVPLEQEVAQRCTTNPAYVRLWNAAQADDVDPDQRAFLQLQLEMIYNTTVANVRSERAEQENHRLASRDRERRQMERLMADPKLGKLLPTQADRRAVIAYARQRGIPDLGDAAKALLYDRAQKLAHDDGRKKLVKTRSASVGRGASAGEARTERRPPLEVAQRGVRAIESWYRRNNPAALRVRR